MTMSNDLSRYKRVAFLGLGKMGLPMARRLHEAGAPVVGFDPLGSARQAFAQDGGAAEIIAKVRPLLGAMGKSIFETGGSGSGHAMKALNNYGSAAGLTAACEALQIGQKFGLDPVLMTDVLNASTGRNNSTEVKLKPFVIPKNYATAFSLGLIAKNLRTA